MTNVHSKKVLYSTKYLRLVNLDGWDYIERTTGRDVVCVVPVLINKHGEPELIFIKEFRIPLQDHVISFPAGLVADVNKEETVVEAAYKELQEESGYSAKRLRHLMTGPSSSGMSDEITHFYLADKLTKVNDGGGDETENIEIIKVPLHKSHGWLYSKSNECLVSPKTYIGLYFANQMNVD